MISYVCFFILYFFYFFFFFFFFSSRRRHTRSLRDWSSDVCSSDLQTLVLGMGAARRVPSWDAAQGQFVPVMEANVTLSFDHRSEERRVGKECRSRWWTDE